MKNAQIIDYLTSLAWALYLPTLEKLAAIVERHTAGVQVDAAELAEIHARRAAAHGPGADGADMEMHGGVAVLPIMGVLAPRANQVNGSSQPRGTSLQTISSWLDQAAAARGVHTVLLHIDSPGGSVEGVSEITEQIARLRESKRVVALAGGGSMASLAYWIGSQAETIYTSPTAAIGSIGVYSVVADYSRAAEAQGIKVHVLRTGPHKGAGVPGDEVTNEQLAGMQESVDHYYGMFIDAVAAGRGMARDRVLEVADGRVHVGTAAITLGLADQVGRLHDLIGELNAEPPEDSAARRRLAASNQTTAAGAANNPEDDTMDKQTQPAAVISTVAHLEAHYGDLVAQLRATAVTEAREAAIAEERDRIAYIHAKAKPFQAEVAAKLVAEGASKHQALEALHEDLVKNADKRAKAANGNDPLPHAGGDPDGGADEDTDRVWDEATKAYVNPHVSAPADDYAACKTAEDVEALAKRHYQGMSAEQREAVGSEKNFVAGKRGKWKALKRNLAV